MPESTQRRADADVKAGCTLSLERSRYPDPRVGTRLGYAVWQADLSGVREQGCGHSHILRMTTALGTGG
jgi:hypothetical protein